MTRGIEAPSNHSGPKAALAAGAGDLSRHQQSDDDAPRGNAVPLISWSIGRDCLVLRYTVTSVTP